jgi:nucleoside-diphosphate-sugar epimerase
MMRVLVSGGTGFIGAPTVALLAAEGFEVHVMSQRRTAPGTATTHHVDLLAPGRAAQICTAIRPTHLLHLAWYAEPGRFWHDVGNNLRWVEASLALVRGFLEVGGAHVVCVGTSAEPPPGERPASVYAASKAAVRTALEPALARSGASFAWAKLHQPYGPGEDERRLLPTVARTLAGGAPFEATTSGRQRRDFVHVADVASALVTLLYTGASGTFDVGTGRATAVREVVEGVATRFGATELVSFGHGALPQHEPERLQADVAPLTALGWRPQVSLGTGLDELVRYWRTR